MEYLDKKLAAYAKSGIYPFHMPGHKRRPLPFLNPYTIDITEIEGFDNLHHAEGILKEGQQRVARLYGAHRSYYLVNGSTCGLLAAISAAVPRRGKILVARNSHKAVYHAISLRELSAEYLYPVIADCGIQGQVAAEQVKEALAAHPDCGAVVITSPTYEGIVSDIKAIADVAHASGVPLIVDAAHGAHFGFGGGFPESPVHQGADAVIMSLHKTLPSFTQTAVLHLCSGRIRTEQVERFLDIYETSSPSYLFMAGMDACVRMMAEEQTTLFAEYERKLTSFYERVRDLKALKVLTREMLGGEEAFDWDYSKIVMFTTGTGLGGEALKERLLTEYKIELEMASGDYTIAMTSVMDTEEGFDRLCAALHEIDNDLCKTGIMKGAIIEEIHFIRQIYAPNPGQLEIAAAEELPCEWVPAKEAFGRISSDFVYLYPPGIPLIVPGEQITEEFVSRLKTCRGKGLTLQGGGVSVDNDCIFLKTILY